MMDVPLPSPSCSIRSTKPAIPLLSLAPPALALGDELAVGEPGDDNNAGEIWNVITRAADLVKDGERLENLAWRHWGQPRRSNQDATRRLSMSSQATTASTASIHTPIDSAPPPFLHRTRSSEKLTFGGALKLLLEKDENNFKDWVEDAKRHLPSPSPIGQLSPPIISVPDTPVANVEIRLVEPTPVPSRVGSLGGSMNNSGLLSSNTTIPPPLKEDIIGEEKATKAEKDKLNQRVSSTSNSALGSGLSKPISTPTPSRRSSYSKNKSGNSPKKKSSKFFVQSSPGRYSGSDSSHPNHTSPDVSTLAQIPGHSTSTAKVVSPSITLSPNHKHGRRRSSGDSSTGLIMGKGKPSENHSTHVHPHPHPHPPHQKRHVSLSTMKGKFQAEKRRMAEQHSALNGEKTKDNEESGWEDEEEDLGDEDGDENWSDEDDSPKDDKKVEEQNGKLDHAPQSTTAEITHEKELQKEKERDNKSSSSSRPSLNRRRSSSRPRMGRTTSDDHQPDLLTLLTRKPSQHGQTHQHKDAPPAPAPTPLIKMSKKERLKAKVEREKIEAQLEAQRQREMFAKQQIFGTKNISHNQGLLASALQRGASMVNLTSLDGPTIRPSPTHGQLPSLASSPAPGPSLLRSKSVVAMPVQTGVSVTIPPHALNAVKEKQKKPQKSSNSQEKAKATVEMESSSEEESDADADYLNTTQTKQKLAALAAKRDAKTHTQTKAQPQISPQNQVTQQIQQKQQPRPQPQPTKALPAFPRMNEYGYVQPMSPTTKRRNIIMAEMSESLRRNVVLEREKSSGGGPRALGLIRPPPSTHTSRLTTVHSAVNLTQYSRGGGGETMERTSSHPARASPNTSQPSSHTGAITTIPSPPTIPQPPSLDTTRRRTTPNILGGGNFLRPLTKALTAQAAQPQKGQAQVRISNQVEQQTLNRNSSSTNLSNNDGNGNTTVNGNIINNIARSESPSNLGAPAMMRRSTEGDELHKERERRRELARRRDTTDTSYRLHGW
ncbi:uncharacterized protein L201_004857 [Kwoniella dendrophila CBS 6074]|uniref:Nitrogen regulatory protein areA GATA-like domain-containing protein n=1 Tax=Kwoniella dendrophila CBS 6074 TaxID=1295534 RepID=A0AAX4JYI2_9TREE